MPKIPAGLLLPAVLILVGVFSTGRMAAEDAWHLPQARFRLTIEKTAQSPWPVRAGYIEVFPYHLRATACRIGVFSFAELPVSYRVLWRAEGEPLKIIFDTSSENRTYYIYFDDQLAETVETWNPQAGLVLETRRQVGGSANSWAEARKLWESSKPVLGRSLVPNIFSGSHPHGPTNDFIAYFRGYFLVAQPGEYGFATISDDASFLFVDRENVVAWPGQHGVWDGRRAEHRGEIKLEAGIHCLEYLNVQNDQGYSVTAAWKPPEAQAFDIMPAQAFLPVAEFVPIEFKTTLAPPTCPYFQWQVESQLVVEELALVKMKFSLLKARPGLLYKWTFDDGETMGGAEISHLFLTRGPHQFGLEMIESGRPGAKIGAQVNVQPDWSGKYYWSKSLAQQYQASLLARDLMATPATELLGLYEFSKSVEDFELMRKIAALIMLRKKEFRSGDGRIFSVLGHDLQHHQVRDYQGAKSAFEYLLEPGIATDKKRETAKLHLAGLLIHGFNDAAEAEKLLSSIPASGALDGDEQKLLKLYWGDLRAATGKLDEAMLDYASGADKNKNPNPKALEVTTAAAVHTARNYLAQNEYDAAAELLRKIEFDSPPERLNPEIGLMLARIHLARQEYPFAHSRCRRMLQAPFTEKQYPELLLALLEACLAMDRTEEAKTCYKKLADEFPYSKAMAEAGEKWGRELKSPAGENHPGLPLTSPRK